MVQVLYQAQLIVIIGLLALLLLMSDRCQYYHDSSNHIALYFTCHKRLVQIVNPKGIVTDEAMLVQRVLIL